MKKILLFIILLSVWGLSQQKDAFQITRLKYNGGSDWYNGQSEEVNLLNFIAANTDVKVNPEYSFVDISSNDIFAHPFLFMTGHGNINFSDEEAQRLRKYLENGGFLYVDDDYGLDKAFRREIKKVFPDKELKERSEEHTSELQSHSFISYAVFCLKKKIYKKKKKKKQT